jgi:DNA-binding transcriptional ArsR family regulator
MQPVNMTHEELDRVFGAVAAYFSVMSEPTRLKILNAICKDEKSVSEIVEEVGATQTNVSRHLGLMYRSGVVARRKEANQVFYRIADPAMMEICRTVCLQIAGQIDEREPLRKDLLKLVPSQRRKSHLNPS